MKRAALYIRVSTMEQAKEGYSIPAQTSKLKAYAEAKDYYVVNTYTDPGYSGAKLERPGLKQLISDVKAKKIDVVIVYKLDRLSRSQKNTLYLIEDVFQKHDVDFISMLESFDTSTPFGRATIGMLSVFAQLERDTITERMHMGRTERAKQGYYHGSGVVPIGYDYVNGELVINEYEAGIVREIFDLYVHHGKGQQHITRKMVQKYPEKVKTLTIIKYALQNPIYIGKISWDGQVYDGKHTPIISLEQYEQAQKIFKEKAKQGTTNHNQKSLLAGFITCGKCGAKVFREAGGGGRYNGKRYNYTYYTCRSVKKMMPSLVKDWNCDQKRLRCELVEDKVINAIKTLDFGKIRLNIKNEKIDTCQKMKEIEKALAKKEIEKSKLIDLYQFGTIEVDILNERIDKINQSLDELKNDLEMLAMDDDKNEKMLLLDEAENFDWENSETALKIDIIRRLVDSVTLLNEDVIVNFIF
ncbi:recombinase family protein [Enterococcus casseliflavus]|uniref:recombinase family protein n=1 Tax=Enterococcus casseliflavus TaxID=37734 RepID=UPI00232D9C90|nr:recombinase family protein [Enterococcus casseliflavus]MDB1687468.1 recombinase family protein [Enterococcus casseliflavus]